MMDFTRRGSRKWGAKERISKMKEDPRRQRPDSRRDCDWHTDDPFQRTKDNDKDLIHEGIATQQAIRR